MNVKSKIGLMAAALAISACGSFQREESKREEVISKEIPQAFLSEIKYSNLLEETTQQKVKEDLKKAGVNSEYISIFFDDVNNFNKTIDNTGFAKGFVTSQQIKPRYDLVKIHNQWAEKNPDFPGYNCRLTTYGLIRDFVKIEHPEKADSSNLFIDEEAIETNPKKLFNSDEKSEFMTLFSQIPTILDKDVYKHLAIIKKDWKQKGVKFIHKGDKTKASFIFVFFHSSFGAEDNTLFIGHTGVLVPTSDGKLMFIEKVAFEEPYQALIFSNRTELNDYLMNRYDIEWGQPTAKPFILENDEMLKGYRPNPNNKNE